MRRQHLLAIASLLFSLAFPGARIVAFPSGNLTLHGVLYEPKGNGPFPAVVFNHGSARGTYIDQAVEALGPVFTSRGWVFFAPYRRGQGLSEDAGPYIQDQIAAAVKQGGITAGAATMIHLLETDHLNDQLAALAWLRKQDFVRTNRIAVMGNSFGGIEALLGAERGDYCAAVDAAGGAESWSQSTAIQDFMTHIVRDAQIPVLFFQAENDYDLSPSRVLPQAMKDAGKTAEAKIYPAFGASPMDGHTFAYFASSVWANDVFHFLEEHCRK